MILEKDYQALHIYRIFCHFSQATNFSFLSFFPRCIDCYHAKLEGLLRYLYEMEVLLSLDSLLSKIFRSVEDYIPKVLFIRTRYGFVGGKMGVGGFSI